MLDLQFSPIVWFILLAFASFRLSWMIARQDGPFGTFEEIRNQFGKRVQTGKIYWMTLSEFVNCPLCLGVWVSAILLIAVIFPAIVIKLIILWLAVSGLQSFLSLLIIKDE